MILSGNSLRQRIERDRILTPFAPHKVREENGRKLAASYGLSEAGYDLRFGDQVAEILSNGEEWSPYNANQVIQSTLRTITPEEARDGLLIQPQGFMLVRSLEYIRMAAVNPRIRPLTMPRAGHALHLERPDHLTHILCAFLGEKQK